MCSGGRRRTDREVCALISDRRRAHFSCCNHRARVLCACAIIGVGAIVESAFAKGKQNNVHMMCEWYGLGNNHRVIDKTTAM